MNFFTKLELYSALITLVAFLLFIAFITDNCTGRKFEDGIKKAEIHHMLTGKYYNSYKVLDNDSTYILITNEAPFETTYWNKLPVHTIEK